MTSSQPMHDALRVEVECTGPLPQDVKVFVVDPDTGYKSLLEGVMSVSFYASMGSINSINLEVRAEKVNMQGVLDKVENKSDTD